jgi:spore coat protein A
VRQIGTDGGLLANPVKVPKNGLLMASAERADLYIDFGQDILKDKKQIVLVNTALAPFQSYTVETMKNPLTAGTPDPTDRLPWPYVMSFELGKAPASDPATDLISKPKVQLGIDLGPDNHDQVPKGHGHRTIALVESPPGMLQMFELAEVSPDQAGRFIPLANGGPITLQDDPKMGPVTYVPVAAQLEDRVAFFVPYGAWEVWRVVNLTTDTHPFHIHLAQFRIIARQQMKDGSFNQGNYSPMMGLPPTKPIILQPSGSIDDNEKGWKDTVRVNPGEMVSFAAKFDGFTGQYMYHCHILEHEDHDMMRPFVVMPREVMDVLDADKDMAMLDGMSMGAMG